MKKLKIALFVIVTSLAGTILTITPLRAQIENFLTFNMGTYWIDTSIVPGFNWNSVNNYLGGYPNAIPGGKLEQYGTSNWYLQWILEYTSLTFQELYKNQALMTPITSLSNSLLADDDSDATAQFQSDFSKYGTQVNKNITSQVNGMNETFVKDILTSGGREEDPTTSNFPYANEVNYMTLLNKPYFSYNSLSNQGQQDEDAMHYIQNASGATIPHTKPSSDFSGDPLDQDTYLRYYKTITAISTFNTFILSDLYYDSLNKKNLTELQQQLIKDASDSKNWFAQVASEKMGIVFRQTLLFTSQIYLLMVQMVQLQKELLSAQAMTNSLLIVGNLYTESTLLKNAKVAAPEGTPGSVNQ